MPRTTLLLSITLLVLAMASIQSGASLAKSLFPLIGPAGTTALRLSLGALILWLVAAAPTWLPDVRCSATGCR